MKGEINETLNILIDLEQKMDNLADYYEDIYNSRKRIEHIIDEKVDGMGEAAREAQGIVMEAKEKYLEQLENDGWIPTALRLPDEDERKRNELGVDPGSTFIVVIKGAERPTSLTLLEDDTWEDRLGHKYHVEAWREFPTFVRKTEENNN